MQAIDQSTNLFKNINTNGSTVITDPVELIALVINTKGASSNTAKIFQATTADPQLQIANIDTTVTPGRFDYGLPCVNGLVVVTATGTAPDITLVYRRL